VLRKYVRERKRATLHARDVVRVNRAADRLNREAADVLEYQAFDRNKPSESASTSALAIPKSHSEREFIAGSENRGTESRLAHGS